MLHRAVRRPRVLINALSLTLGGGRSYIQNVLRELGRDPRDLEFTVLAAEGQLSETEAAGIPLATRRLAGKKSWSRTLLRVLYEETILPVRARSFDLLYCVADLSPAVASTPTVVALRNLNIYDRRFYDDARTRTLYRCVRLGLRRCRRIICPSRAAAERIALSLGIPLERITVVPHGIAAEAFAARADPPPAAAPYLFLSAAVERHKNIGAAIEGLCLQSDPRLELWIAGTDQTDPACAAELRDRAARLGLGERVRFLGVVPYREILSYYRGATAFVFPSLIETFGHPLLEAMLAGAPILAADIPVFRELAEGVALFFPPRDAAALAREIDRVRAEPEASRARVERGRERAAAFSWRRSVDLLCEVLTKALEAR